MNIGFGYWSIARRHWCTLKPFLPHVLVTDGCYQHVTQPPDSQKNFLVVDNKTENATIEATFERFTTERKDIGIVLINQHVSEQMFTSWGSERGTNTRLPGRRQDTTSDRYLHRSLPYHPRDTKQRPPVRPREGQCVAEGSPSIRRVATTELDARRRRRGVMGSAYH